MRAQSRVDGCDESSRKLVLRRADRDSRSKGGNRVVADELVDDLGGLPQPHHVDAAVHACARKRACERLPRDAVEHQRDWIGGTGDKIGAGPGGFEGRCEPAAGGTLAVEADRKPAPLRECPNQLVGTVRLEGAGRIVQEHPLRTKVRQLFRLLD